jgi:F0F1-type ATP synthase assembly protein I
MSDVQARGSRLVVRVVLLQAGCALLAASLMFAWKGAASGLAALSGGLIVAAGTGVFGWRAFAPGVANAAVVGRAMFAGWALKWAWLIAALYVALARFRLDPPALGVGLVAAQVGYWVGMMRSK